MTKFESIKDYIKKFQSITFNKMIDGIGLKSLAPIQSFLKHLQDKGYISWLESKSRNLQLVNDIVKDIPF